MAVSVRAAGTWAAATTQSPSYAIPGGYQAGDLGILVSAWKPFGTTATVNQGWSEIYDNTGGSTGNGNGTGSNRLYVAYKVLTASESNPTVTRSTTVSPGGGVIIVLQKAAGEVWDIEMLSAAVESTGNPFTHSLTTTVAVQDTDWVFAFTAVADESATFTRATTAISGASVTWNGNVVEYPATHLSSTAGNDIAADLIYRAVTTGAASGASIAVTGTLSASERHASVLFRVGVDAVTNADAEVSTATGAANAASTSIEPAGGQATGTGAAYNATVEVTVETNAPAGLATGTGAAYGAATAISPNPSVATATGAAYAASTSVAPNAAIATATGTAYDATVTVAASTDAPAEVATATGAAYTASTSVATGSGVATATGAALDATVATAAETNAPAEVATASGAAHAASTSIAVGAATATATGAAYDATASTVADADADAGIATATGAANQPSISIVANASTATATGAAHGAAPSLTVLPGGATATGTAHDATTTATGGVTSAAAGRAQAFGTAYDATVQTTGGGRSPRGGPRFLGTLPDDDDEDAVLLLIA